MTTSARWCESVRWDPQFVSMGGKMRLFKRQKIERQDTETTGPGHRLDFISWHRTQAAFLWEETGSVTHAPAGLRSATVGRMSVWNDNISAVFSPVERFKLSPAFISHINSSHSSVLVSLCTLFTLRLKFSPQIPVFVVIVWLFSAHPTCSSGRRLPWRNNYVCCCRAEWFKRRANVIFNIFGHFMHHFHAFLH